MWFNNCYAKWQTRKNQAWLVLSLFVSRLEAVTFLISASQYGRDFVPCDWVVIQQIYHISSNHSTNNFCFWVSVFGWGSRSYQFTLLFSSSSEMQKSEESLSQVNSALKQVTIELETARGDVLALNDTKDSVTKEINDLQQTLTGKHVLRAWIKRCMEAKTKKTNSIFTNLSICIEMFFSFYIWRQKKRMHLLKPIKQLKMSTKNLNQQKR